MQGLGPEQRGWWVSFGIQFPRGRHPKWMMFARLKDKFDGSANQSYS